MKWPDHGGQPHLLQKQLHMKTDELLDFSANINPLGPPEWLEEKAASALKRMHLYPDPDYPEAVHAIAAAEGVERENVLLTNGGAEAIFLASRLISGKKAVIIEPAFNEYSRACFHYATEVERFFYKEDFTFPIEEVIKAVPNASAVFICRPHNPSGTVMPETEVHRLAEEASKHHTYLFIDEAFIDFLPEEKLTSFIADYRFVVLLRSFTKIFAVPGLRCGCVIADAEVIAELKGYQLPWSVNAVSEAVIPPMMEDEAFIDQTITWLRNELRWIDGQLSEKRWYRSGSRVNFYLLADKTMGDQEPLLRWLMKKGIAVRHTYSFSGVDGRAVRTAVRSRKENEKLVEALKSWEDL
ncbi:pyridoxal phosphate-dependent aminotransferase [Alkalicoccus halolimnae]|uniref:Threonine-phosphate decarboxylase n=1 Tax=Alkalicoccus halolimnae TaxID=1667239 RepID=A0A5C7FD07_9BACI|nr:threonine-phosphate decarboxylase [Alkalicoccus halolimnae]TXF82781.1 pyridoxal phosphate-dependent class II aminotransferase [Alkalicoccus halolimnae]